MNGLVSRASAVARWLTVVCALGLAGATSAGASGLPDGRGYELVTTGTQGAPIGTIVSDVVPTSGDTLSFETSDAPSSSPSSLAFNTWTATRSATGWTDTNLAPALTQPEAGLAGTYFDAVSADAQQAVISTDQPLTAGAPQGSNLYLRGPAGTETLLSPHDGGSSFTASFAGVSSDFSHVFLSPSAPLLPSDPVGSSNLYQWAQGRLSIVNVMPDGQLGQSSASIPYVQNESLSAISTDGSDVLFQEAGSPVDLYLRRNGTTTVDVSAPQGAPADASSAATAQGILPDGGEVLFTDTGQLTADANTGGGSDAGSDLYEYDVASGALTDLTPDHRSGDADGADVSGVVAASSSGDYVYFEATGVLATGAVAGQTNLYVDHDDAIRLVATGAGLGSDFYATPDGTHLAFESSDSLTGYDNTDALTSQPDREVYEYTATDGGLVCVSCRASGAQPTGPSQLAAYVSPPSRELTDDGSRVFFESADAVVPAAANGLMNVYEYENGAASLISPGNGGSAALLIGATPSGDDVFFESHDDLTPPENAGLAPAIYDAHVGGGFPTASTPSAPCASTDGCRATAPVNAPAPVVATATFRGPGNETHRSVARVVVMRHTVTATRIAIRVRIPVAGRLIVTGASTGEVARTFTRARAATVTLTLTARARRALARHHHLRIVVRLRFSPRSGGTASTTVHVTDDQETHR